MAEIDFADTQAVVYRLAKSVIKQAYDSTADRHPSTAEVMDAFDRMADSGVIDRKSVAGKLAADVVKVLLGVARRNSDGRWLSNLYLYKKEQLHSDDSFCSQKTKKKSNHTRDYTRLQLTASVNGEKEGKTKESFFNRITPSHSPEKVDRESAEKESLLENQQINDEKTSSEEDIEFQDSQEELPKDQTPVAESKPILHKISNQRLPSEISAIGCRLNTSKNRSDLRANLKLMSKSTDNNKKEQPKIDKLSRTASFEVISTGPPLVESGYVFYRIRLLSKAMYALQTTKAFGIRLRKFLQSKVDNDKLSAQTQIFAALKSNLQEVKRAWHADRKAVAHWKRISLSESMYRWRCFHQISRKQTIMSQVIQKRSRKRTLRQAFGHMHTVFRYRVEVGRTLETLEHQIAANRVSRAMVTFSDLIKERKAEESATRFLKYNTFVKFINRVREMKEYKKSRVYAFLKKKRINILAHSFNCLSENLVCILGLYTQAEMISEEKLKRKSIAAWKDFLNQRPSLPEFSERQSTLVAKYLTLMNSEEGRRQSDFIGGQWSATSRVTERDLAEGLGETSERERKSDASQSPFEEAQISQRQQQPALVHLCLLKQVFQSWKDSTGHRSLAKRAQKIGRLARAWDKFTAGIEKIQKLRTVERRIRIVKDSAVKEIAFCQWKEICRTMTKAKSDQIIAENHCREQTLKKIVECWRTTIIWEMATERKIRRFEVASRKILLKKSLEGLKSLSEAAKNRKRFELFVENTYVRSLLAKSMIGLGMYTEYRRQKAVMATSYTAALTTICKRRPLRAMLEVVFRRSRLRVMVSKIEDAFKRQILKGLKMEVREQDQKVRNMRLYGKEKVMKRSVLRAWNSRVKTVAFQREKIEEIRTRSQFTDARPFFMVWVRRARVILDATERENAARDFYDIKILVQICLLEKSFVCLKD